MAIASRCVVVDPDTPGARPIGGRCFSQVSYEPSELALLHFGPDGSRDWDRTLLRIGGGEPGWVSTSWMAAVGGDIVVMGSWGEPSGSRDGDLASQAPDGDAGFVARYDAAGTVVWTTWLADVWPRFVALTPGRHLLVDAYALADTVVGDAAEGGFVVGEGDFFLCLDLDGRIERAWSSSEPAQNQSRADRLPIVAPLLRAAPAGA